MLDTALVSGEARVTSRQPADRSLRIAMLAPPWIPVPPPGYGGIEAVVDLLCAALVRRGHEVTLFAAPGSRSLATVVTPLERSHPSEIERALHEVDHVARAVELIEAGAPHGRPYDLVHDHCGFTTVAMADRIGVPVVHTLHGPLDELDVHAFYRYHGHKVAAVAISRAQARTAPATLRVEAVIPNPIDVSAWPLVIEKDDYLLWIGRMAPCKGAHRAIDVARRANARLVLAGPVQPGQEEYFRGEVAPLLDPPRITWIGEVGGRRKQELFARARALLMPIRWPEPFGMVMVEALAAGTPVLAFPEGAAAEIVEDGVTGYLVSDEAAMAAAVAHIGAIDPRRCRAAAATRFDAGQVAAAYERLYRRVAASATRPPREPRAAARHLATVARRPTHSPGRQLAGTSPPQGSRGDHLPPVADVEQRPRQRDGYKGAVASA
jgi:glycosyltransferase involved in cell wall biosynthesis